MASDAVILSLERLEFTWSTAHTLRGYLIGVAADSFGSVQVVEVPSSTFIKHRPLLGRPFVWPLAFEGFMFYQRTGGLPDFVSFSLMIVRDREAARRAGDVMERLGKDPDFGKLLGTASKLAAGAGGAGVAVSAVADLGKQAVGLIGRQLADAQDKLLDTLDGSMIFDAATKTKTEIAGNVQGAIAKATFDFHLFDAVADGDSKLALSSSLEQLRSQGLLVGGAQPST
jgi:hypothetical protein